ncbi:MAG: hypothetical protein QOK48_1142 [Blastocatellia bacterium]|jgi:hypothetical protein|nr:hypothetical protein [Blastocatellia bacterium]
MFLKRIAVSLFPAVLICASALAVPAQDATSPAATQPQAPDAQKQQEEKLKLENKAAILLDQLVTEAQSLKLPENRIRVQITAGDMLWDRNAARARGLLNDAGVILSQMMIDTERPDRSELQNLNQLRQDLVLTAGRHDAELGYQLLRSTQPPTNITNPGVTRRPGPDQQANLEQNLLAVIAANDPKVAYQKAVEALDKGEYPTALSSILSQLQAKDPDNFKKLTEKTLSRLGSDDIAATRGAATLATILLMPGPKVANTSNAAPANAGTANPGRGFSAPVLSETAYHDLMDKAITAALSVTSLAGPVRTGGGGARMQRGAQPAQQNPPDDAQVRQQNARIMLFSLQALLPQIDQYLPDRAQAVRQKLTELGMGNAGNVDFGNQMRAAMAAGTSDSLLTAASTAPAQMQPMLYQQAARKAVDEGNSDRALQIATDHLDEPSRNSIMQAVDFKRMATTASPEKLNEIKQKLAALPSDSDRVKYLIDLSTATQKDNPRLALRFLDDARIIVSKRVGSYKEFEDQLKVADAFGALDPKRSFELLEMGIGQLNELLSAASVLNGFEVDMYKDGELSLRGDNDLVAMVARYGQELATLARIDFDHARMTADRFQLIEPRLNAKLSIVQNILGVQPMTNFNNRRGQNNFQFVMR